MKSFIHKIQDLGQKAAQIRQVIDSAPAQAAQIRETVLMTASQLQQMRVDVQTAAGGLRADNEERLAHALRELNDGTETFLEAGYQLMGVDMEVSPVQRLIVHLARVDGVSEPTMHALISANLARPTISALLTSLAKAELMAGKMNLPNMSYRELVVHVGPTPLVRLCWQADELIDVASPTQPELKPPPIPGLAAAPVAPPASPSFTQSNYFEPRAAVPKAEIASTEAATEVQDKPAAAVAAAAHRPEKRVTGSDWKQSALDRFKKMPDASKYRR